MKKLNLLSKAEMKKVMGGVLPVDDGESGGSRYKCVYPTGESNCYTYTTTPTCGKDYTGAQGTLTAC